MKAPVWGLFIFVVKQTFPTDPLLGLVCSIGSESKASHQRAGRLVATGMFDLPKKPLLITLHYKKRKMEKGKRKIKTASN